MLSGSWIAPPGDLPKTDVRRSRVWLDFRRIRPEADFSGPLGGRCPSLGSVASRGIGTGDLASYAI